MLDWFNKKTEGIVKGLIVKKMNGLLKQYKDNVQNVVSTLGVWIRRLKKIIECLESISSRLQDNEIDPNELEATRQEIDDIVREW